MKVILDNIIFFLQRSGGMSVYWSETISRLEQKKSLDIHYLEPAGSWVNIFYGAIRSHISDRIEIEKWPAKPLSFRPFKTNIVQKHIFHSSYYRTSRASTAINIVTIHDFIPELFFTGIRRYLHTYRKRKAIEHADGIICISENTRQDLLKLYPLVRNIHSRVIYNGVSTDYYPLAEGVRTDVNSNNKYILYVGKRPPYKNFQFAVEVLASLKQYHFVIAGDALSEKEKQQLVLLNGRFTLAENPTNSTLNQLYNQAHCLLYPSSYEGFGIPVIEAMRAGCPVVALRSGAVFEIAGNAALLAGDLSIQEFSENIYKLENAAFRSEIVAQGLENAKRFSWDNSADQLALFYEAMYNA